ncbi:hypothetical protein IG3_05925 [Bacillus cereus HuA2-1]|uniref:Uncharacterized protein n=1 Tax=Bacillus cereus HuA2-1 TaxID=1053201 RepID=J8XXU3_BACCE|nr:hypothetical protein IG3_05925 [Bacillus cereus HuA2-1]
MKPWIKVICITSFVFQMTACSSSTQTAHRLVQN